MPGTKSTAQKLEPTSRELPVKVTFNPFALSSAITKAHDELSSLADASIDNDEDAHEANAELRARLVELDAVVAMKAEARQPLIAMDLVLDKLFDAGIDAAKTVVDKLRRMLESYELEKRAERRKALDEAARAATQATPKALHTALAAASDAAPTQLEGTSFKRTWAVKRYVANCVDNDGVHRHVMSMIPDKFWAIDEKALAKIGREHKGDDPPTVPGVVWEEKLSSRVQRVVE